MASQTKKDNYYVIHYRDPRTGENVTLKARRITDSTLGLSFVCVSDFIFESEGLVIKPAEEQLRQKLENVRSLHLSIYTILSVEEVGRQKLSFKKDRSNLVAFPTPQNSPQKV